jgi:hypothetical protein
MLQGNLLQLYVLLVTLLRERLQSFVQPAYAMAEAVEGAGQQLHINALDLPICL